MAQATPTHTWMNGGIPAPGPVCRPARKRAGAGTRIFDERSLGPGDVSGPPGTSRTAQVLPVLVKASPARIATGMNLASRPRHLDKGVNMPQGAPSGDLLTCPLGRSLRSRRHGDRRKRRPLSSDLPRKDHRHLSGWTEPPVDSVRPLCQLERTVHDEDPAPTGRTSQSDVGRAMEAHGSNRRTGQHETAWGRSGGR